MSYETQQLISALLQFVDKRGHWPTCPQSRRRSNYWAEDRHGDEIVRPCSPACRKARQAIEAAGGTVVQVVGSRLRPDRSDDWYREMGGAHWYVPPHCMLSDPSRPIHQRRCRHEGAAS
jgi:hypothetical protein